METAPNRPLTTEEAPSQTVVLITGKKAKTQSSTTGETTTGGQSGREEIRLNKNWRANKPRMMHPGLVCDETRIRELSFLSRGSEKMVQIPKKKVDETPTRDRSGDVANGEETAIGIARLESKLSLNGWTRQNRTNPFKCVPKRTSNAGRRK